MRQPEKECWSCGFCDRINGICWCEDSPCYTEFVSEDDTCRCWKPIPEEAEDSNRAVLSFGKSSEESLHEFYEQARPRSIDRLILDTEPVWSRDLPQEGSSVNGETQ